MLVLSRKVRERVLIGDLIAITVVRIGPNSVRIGIEAPSSMNIARDELTAQVSSALANVGVELVSVGEIERLHVGDLVEA